MVAHVGWASAAAANLFCLGGILRDEFEADRVHAVAQTGRRRPVVEDVTEMGAADRADDFGPPHEEAVVGAGRNASRRDRLPEARPSGAGFKFGLGAEQRISIERANIAAVAMLIPILAGEGSFGSFLPAHLVLLGRH